MIRLLPLSLLALALPAATIHNPPLVLNPYLTPHIEIPFDGGVQYAPLIIEQGAFPVIPRLVATQEQPPASQTPEPGSLIVFGPLFAGAWIWRRRQRR